MRTTIMKPRPSRWRSELNSTGGNSDKNGTASSLAVPFSQCLFVLPVPGRIIQSGGKLWQPTDNILCAPLAGRSGPFRACPRSVPRKRITRRGPEWSGHVKIFRRSIRNSFDKVGRINMAASALIFRWSKYFRSRSAVRRSLFRPASFNLSMRNALNMCSTYRLKMKWRDLSLGRARTCQEITLTFPASMYYCVHGVCNHQ